MSKAQPRHVVDMDRFALEGQLWNAKAIARRLFAALHACNGYLLGRVFDYSDPEIARVLDPVFDAALILQERHRIYIEPCRRTVESHDQLYLALYPNGRIVMSRVTNSS